MSNRNDHRWLVTVYESESSNHDVLIEHKFRDETINKRIIAFPDTDAPSRIAIKALTKFIEEEV